MLANKYISQQNIPTCIWIILMSDLCNNLQRGIQTTTVASASYHQTNVTSCLFVHFIKLWSIFRQESSDKMNEIYIKLGPLFSICQCLLIKKSSSASCTHIWYLVDLHPINFNSCKSELTAFHSYKYVLTAFNSYKYELTVINSCKSEPTAFNPCKSELTAFSSYKSELTAFNT